MVEEDNGQYDDCAEILWATGACLMIRSADYWAVGGLDGRFFAHNEEIDLCWRLHLRGRKIYCVPDSEVCHVGGGTLPKSNPMKTYLNFRNNLTMLYKNLPAEDLRRVMIMRWFLDYLAAFSTLILNRNVGDFKAILRLGTHSVSGGQILIRTERLQLMSAFLCCLCRSESLILFFGSIISRDVNSILNCHNLSRKG